MARTGNYQPDETTIRVQFAPVPGRTPGLSRGLAADQLFELRALAVGKVVRLRLCQGKQARITPALARGLAAQLVAAAEAAEAIPEYVERHRQAAAAAVAAEERRRADQEAEQNWPSYIG